MPVFKHPCLVRGVVHTPYGAFSLERGFVEMPEEVGEALGWARVSDEPPPSLTTLASTTPKARPAPDGLRAR